MPQRYLLTGCAGFIGSAVGRLLLEAGHEVVGVDNLNDAYDPRLKRWRLDRLQGLAGFRFIEADVTDRAALDRVFAEPGRPLTLSRGEREPEPDAQHGGASASPPLAAVLNLAARAGVRPSVDNPWLYFDVNATGCLNLLDLCRRHGVRKFVLASTSSVYGDQDALPFREDADTSRPLSPYAASKKAAETLAYTYHRLYGLDVTVLRYFTVYGPAGRPDMSVFRFIRRVHEGQPIVVYGDGQQRRDFTYVDDIARGTLAALRPLGYEIVNLGGDRPTALADLIELLAQLLGRRPEVQRRQAHPADVRATWADIAKARRLLDWQPQTSLDDGLRQAIAWYRQERDWVRGLSDAG